MTTNEAALPQNEIESSAKHNVLLAHSWFHGILTKSQVDQLMTSRGDGHFLVRESTSCPGTYILVVSYRQDLVKFVIEKRDGGYVIIHASKRVYPKVFKTIPEIIEHFRKERSGMPTRLLIPIQRKVLGFGIWECQRSNGGWRIYSGSVNSIIEQAILTNETTVRVQINSQNYTIRLDNRTQHNHQTGSWRRIRRRQVTTKYEDASAETDVLVSPRMRRSQTSTQVRMQPDSRTSPGLVSSGMSRSKSFRDMQKSRIDSGRQNVMHSSKSAYSSPHRTLARSTSARPSNQGTILPRPTSPTSHPARHRSATSPAGEINPNIYKKGSKKLNPRPGSPVPMTRSSSLSPPSQERGQNSLIKSRRPVLLRPQLTAKSSDVDVESMQSNSASAFDADDESDSDDEQLLTSRVQKVSFGASSTSEECKRQAQSHSSLRCPSYWSPLDNSGKRPSLKLVPLLKSSMEYNRILNALLKSMPVVVQRIARIENVDLWQAYYRKREVMQRLCGSGEQVYECSLFHGTRSEFVGSICKQNFDFRLSGGQHGTAYGHGNYFAVSAATASLFSVKDADGNKYIFVCKVLVGDYTRGNPTLRRPPAKFSTNSCYEMYDSVCDNRQEPSLFVVFDNDQAYPDYVITFR